MLRIIVVLSVCVALQLGQPTQAQTRKKQPAQKPSAPVRQASAVEPEVDLRETFSLGTNAERWVLDDPMPTSRVRFGDRMLSLDDRQINAVKIAENEDQYLYPISWFEPYQTANPDLKYVVIKSKEGRISSIMAEYLPEHVSMPSEGFEPYTDGKSLYKDVAVVRKDGFLYLKQVVSSGKKDPSGKLYIDMAIIYKIKE